MKWIEFTVYTQDSGLESVCAALTAVGIDGVVIEESRQTCAEALQQSVAFWDFADMDKIGTDAPCVKAYIEDGEGGKDLLLAAREAIFSLKQQNSENELGSLVIKEYLVDDEDWANNWKKYYKPIEIGQRLLILPSWEDEPKTDRAVLKLDPGMAFGTGAHQTTRMCLEYLEKTVKQGDSVLDLGCGSGILSIASRLLGAKQAIAVDIDPIAESIAKENAELNNLNDENYKVLIGNILTDRNLQQIINGKYPIVVANIVASVIIELAPLAKGLVQKGGYFITSGIIEDRRQEVLDSLSAAGFEILEQSAMQDWNAILCRG